ncbi:unnamed protein product [Lepidochelys kempii]
MKGLFHYTCLSFGVSAPPGIYQRVMDNLFQGMLHVCVYLDDSLITEESESKHLQNLDQVLQKLADADMCLKRETCILQAAKVIYLRHKIGATGLQPVEEKATKVSV